ncbi:syntaxin-binding protein 5 isoform X2 [Onthophagus taurus]|uniref:syntaxin-binding protein 5 isoform X2 n=1 Tax=Onthophagus taurus TaxID=166361 RepID=UPI000C20AFC4|nr:syntaxin-binding protein 5 isoform X4 [Onthophagus taurus]
MRRDRDRDRDGDRREVMKKFTIKGVLDNFRASVAQTARPDQEIQENLKTEHFQVKRTFRHGFPFNPTAMAYDPIQKLLAIGSKGGSLRILGQPGVDVHVRHDMDGPPSSAAVIHLQFLINEGALISATADDSIHLWNFKQEKLPQLVQSLKFQKEKITYMHLPLQSKWLYVGTERGNVHIVHVENFTLSGYVINWNKAMEVTRKTHPGPVVHLSDNPLDANKLLIGFESGQIALWDLRNKSADVRFQTAEQLRSICWHHDGKQFMCSHADGSLTTWTTRQNNKPVHVSQPHAKVNKDGKLEQCKPITKIEWKSSKSGESYVIFSGGMPYDQPGRTPSITVVFNKTTTVLEMEHNVVDFITLCESPYTSELQEPYAIIALLQNDLVVMDLQTAGFPCLENPYPMDIHESPVTCCSYLVDCPADLIPAFYTVGKSGSTKKSGFSEREWVISGGTWSAQSCSYSEIIMTGHADGSIKFWDASAGTLQVLYKLKTAKIFEKPKVRSVDGDEDPFAIELLSLCPESRKLCVAGASSHVILFSYKKTETSEEVPVLEIPIVYEIPDDLECSPDCQVSATGSGGSTSRLDMLDFDNKRDISCSLKVRPGIQKKLPGFQAQLVCLTPHNNGEPPSKITALTLNSSYGLMAYGNEAGIVIVDIEQKVCLLNVGSPDLYGAQDPYSRALRSPKRNNPCGGDGLGIDRDERQPRSPSIDQMNGVCSPAAATTSVMSGAASSSCTSSSGAAVTAAASAQGLGRPRPEPPRRSRSQDKLDNSFSRSRSSSMSSLENITSEAIQCLAFADSYAKRSEPHSLTPTLWVGTSLGSVLTILITPPDQDSRSSQPVVVSLVGVTIFRLKGCILNMSFLDCNGSLIPYTFESWRDDFREKKSDRTPTKCPNRMSPTLSGESQNKTDSFGDRQFVVIASDKQARVVALPSQTCVYRQQIADADFVVKAEIVLLRDSVCLVCFVSNGHLMTYSLPSLRPLIDIHFLPLSELSFQTQTKKGIVDPMLSIWGQQLIINEDTDQIARTFCFSNRGQGLYLCSPSELQKFTLCADFCTNLSEMLGELYITAEMPEPPKEGFFKGLFGGGVRSLDREELFGEASGKANKAVAKHVPGVMQELNSRVLSSTSEISRAHKLAMERGEKLNKLEDSAERMRNEAENFASTAHSLMLKEKDKKWYQL